ncbi:uncharacterized protein LOC124439647 isoform X1 [Xenia sp. Carnegie-2017]|uniref:uncharacterized protein LOC124439647 isoform X1 n=1 Tax=Xenia sp. Carnegie-2017 TaxID=2897299 RepID=UPI001F04E635|nr:uncharacterized protein LOC124439647 isoform X1 [Xenia sp. Carnegie-2017]
MMTSENYSTPKKYRVEASRELYDKENNIKDTSAFKDNSMTVAYEGTDISNTENVSCDSSSTRRNRARRSRDQVSHENSQNNEEMQVEGATAVAENPKSLKKEKPSGKKRKERKNLREKRRSTGVVVMPGLGANDEPADDGKQTTIENTKMNESIGSEDYSPSLSEVSTASTPSRTSRREHDDVDAERLDKQDLLDRIEQLEKALEQKTKEVETLKSENQALLRVVNQVSSLKIK